MQVPHSALVSFALCTQLRVNGSDLLFGLASDAFEIVQTPLQIVFGGVTGRNRKEARGFARELGKECGVVEIVRADDGLLKESIVLFPILENADRYSFLYDVETESQIAWIHRFEHSRFVGESDV